MLILSVIQGPDKGRRFELPDNQPQLLGRSSEALPIGDQAISRRHAELTPDDGIWWIRDLESQNGTYVNGQRIIERTRLRPGDQIRVGATVFVFGAATMGGDSVLSIVSPSIIDAEVERTIASPENEDSVILAEPEPRSAAMEHLRVIYRLTAITTQTTDKEALLAAIMELIFAEFKPERGCIMLRSQESDTILRPAVIKYRAQPKDQDEAKIHVSRTILQHTVKNSEGVLSTNAMTDSRFASGDSVQQYQIRSAICSPVRFRDRVFGAIYIDSSIANYTFTEEQLALMNAIGRHTGLALANADLLAEKLHTERLAAVGETVASLSHSIKNILQGLRGGADVVEMGLKKDDLKIARGGWDILKRNLDRIVGLTLNMLTYSRQRMVEPELVKLDTLIEECAELFEDRVAEKGVALIVDADPEMPPIPIDPNLMHQAVMNLIGNAVDAVEPETGAVTVRTMYDVSDPLLGATPAYAVIEVIDNGPGIPPDRREWIFEPFKTTKGLHGTGLGLAVTKRIVEEHRGRIRLESEDGQGCTFRVTLPADTGGDPSATRAEGSYVQL